MPITMCALKDRHTICLSAININGQNARSRSMSQTGFASLMPCDTTVLSYYSRDDELCHAAAWISGSSKRALEGSKQW
jgi:hypothetical protein